eukprot:CAMPEP_0116918004 /NCGR_PEP_ID=MMETSP0467-20121206/19498_1 /TAXON_ID=283647 /ORGANISM="Mesodinium pulex, Strain SPMC105" /LENGTH=177 /DNA_ID=CAMNT_0004595241 /DNA_START=741 /DNA_END=1273 /DNA_ORIENTATION=+
MGILQRLMTTVNPSSPELGLEILFNLPVSSSQVVCEFVRVLLLVAQFKDERHALAAQLLGLIHDERPSAGLVALVLVLLEVGAALVLLGFPGLVQVVGGRVLVLRKFDGVGCEEVSGLGVAAVDLEGLGEDLHVLADAELEWGQQEVLVVGGVDGVGDGGVVLLELHRLELLALDDA